MRKVPIFALVLLGYFSGIHSWQFLYDPYEMTYFGFEAGYRWDKVDNRCVLYGPAFLPRASTQSAKHVNSLQIGFEGQVECCQFLVKGSYHHGWLGSGHYVETDFKGGIAGSSDDASVGLGYLFPTNRCWVAAGLVGWSIDELDMTGKNVKVPLVGQIIPVGDIKFKSRFQGPWVGTDIWLKPDACFTLVLGHEFHFAYWNGTRFLKRGELGETFGITTGFSNQRHHHSLWGNVFRIEGYYILTETWDVGLKLKYQRWISSGDGEYKRTRMSLSRLIKSKLIEDVEWQSFSLFASLDYLF